MRMGGWSTKFTHCENKNIVAVVSIFAPFPFSSFSYLLKVFCPEFKSTSLFSSSIKQTHFAENFQ
jgi:hypothetical protein